MDTKDKEIARARDLRDKDQLEESQVVLLDLLDKYPEDPLVLYEVGGSFDVMGEERDAISYYEEAIEAGLSGEDLQECLICLGSCRRVIGEFEESVEALETAVSQFPDNKSGHVFLALAYYANDQKEEAMQTLLDALLQTTTNEDILAYADVFEFYKDNLEEVWDED